MSTIQEIFDIEKWQVASLEDISKTLKSKRLKIHSWQNYEKKLSPFSVYKFLKSKFGIANGMSMLFKTNSTDNLIHWHYTFLNQRCEIHFLGKSSGLELIIKLTTKVNFQTEDWEILIQNIKGSFSKYGKQMNEVQSQFQKYTLFINPFRRLDNTLLSLTSQLRSLNVSEIKRVNSVTATKKERETYHKDLNLWINRIEHSVTLGTTIRMLSPVLAESFINLILLVFTKEEYKNDKRLYENLIRQQIDVRVKTLHLNCTCFSKKINSEAQEFKDFQTLMNNRNDFLHGNIDPIRLMFEDVYFDQNFIPLFIEDDGIIIKTMKNYRKNVEAEVAIADYVVVIKFIQFVLSHFKKKDKSFIEHLLMTRMPGYNHSTKGIGILFNVGLAEL